MRSTAALRQQIESSLAARIPAALSVRFQQSPELLSTGITEVDALLQGGLPLATLAEIIGQAGSGRSTLVSSILSEATRQGATCAYVDVTDSFDPFSAAAIGVDLGRLLWIRGTRPADRKSTKDAWGALDQALRATDWLLNAGGFRVIVLDMGDVPAAQVRRLPLASWYRYRLQAEKAQALFLLLAQASSASSCASVALQFREADGQWDFATESRNAVPLLAGFSYSVSAGRKRARTEERHLLGGKKPAEATETTWKRNPQWAR